MSTPEEIIINTKLTGDREVVAGLTAEAEAMRGLGVASAETGLAMSHTARRGFLMNQALFTMRRFLYQGTLALAAMGAGATYMGLKFNANMEMNTVAMAHFLGSTRAAKQELNLLYDLAAKTPFEFPDLTAAARQFLAFGFTLQDTNRYLKIIGDTAAGLAVGKEGIDRMVLAFGQMSTAGRVLGGELRQLQEVGIPAAKILRDELGLTTKQMRNIGALGIPAQLGIEIIMKGMQKRFQGAAAEQAKTFTGMLSTLHDYASQLFGTLTFPLFEWMRTRLLPRLTLILTGISQVMKAGEGFGGVVRVLDYYLTPQSHRVALALNQIKGAVQDLWTVFKGIWKAIYDNRAVWASLVIVFEALHGVLSLLAHTTAIWVPLLKLLIAYLIISRTWTLLNAVATRSWAKSIAFLTFMQKANIATEKALIEMGILWRILIKGQMQAASGQFLALTKLRRAFFFLRAAVFALAGAFEFLFLETPIGWIALAIAALVILYFKWKWFHNLVNSIFNWVKQNWPYLAAMLVTPFGAAVLYIIKHFDAVRDKLTSFFNWVWGKMKWLADKIGWLISKIPGMGGGGGGHHAWWQSFVPSWRSFIPHPPGIPGFQEGGVTPWGGNFLVGERGPEMVSLPGSSRVTPNDKIAPIFRGKEGWMAGGRSQPGGQTIQLVVDGRVLAEVVNNYQRTAEVFS